MKTASHWVCLALLLGQRPAAADDLDEVAVAASTALSAGDWDRALALVEPHLSRRSGEADAAGRAELHLIAAEAWLMLDDPESALASAGTAETLSRATVAGRRDVIAARACALSGDWSGAASLLEGARARGTLDPAAAELLAEAWLQNGRLRDAEPLLRQLFASGDSPAAGQQLAVLLHERGDHEEAAAILDQVMRVDPSDYYSWIYLARSLLEIAKLDAAEKALASAGRIGDTPEIEYLRGRAAAKRSAHAEAIRRFEAAIERDADYTEAYYGLGLSLQASGRAAEARSALERFRALRDRDAKRLQEATAVEQRCRARPQDFELALAAARFHAGEKDPVASARFAWDALRLARSASETIAARRVLAQALAAQGRFGGASRQLEKILAHAGLPEAERDSIRRAIEQLARRSEPAGGGDRGEE